MCVLRQKCVLWQTFGEGRIKFFNVKYENLVQVFIANTLNPIQDGPFRGCSRIEGGPERPLLPKICHTYSTIMKPGTARSKKYMNRVTHALISADMSIFLSEIRKFCYIKKYFGT